jgi:hypothetical protein
VTGSPFNIPMVEVDVVGVEGPTRRARMCCRQATRESGGPEPLSIGPAAHTCPEVGVRLGVPPDLYLIRKVIDVLQLVSYINRHI